MPHFDAIVLTGGRGSRLGGADKAQVPVAGVTLLQRARAAVAEAGTTVVVGPEVAGGPVAGVEAGLRSVGADVVVLLACDMPLVSASTVARLVTALDADTEADAALLTGADGRRQYLAGAYRTDRLRSAVQSLAPTRGRSMRALVEGLRTHAVAAHSEEAMDCDTWPDVERASKLLEGR